jgi:hypothetical protein
MLKRVLKSLKKPVHYKDDYIEILRRVNPGMLHFGNIELFRIAINSLESNNPVLEIGTFCGLSSNLIAYLLKENNKTNNIITTDKWKNANSTNFISNSNLRYSTVDNYVRESLKRNLEFFRVGNLPYSVNMLSDDFFLKWNSREPLIDLFDRQFETGGNFSFVYIDGNHTYDFVKRDFENSDALLEVGGYLMLDDSYDYSDWEVNKLAKEIERNTKYLLIKKNPNYLFKKISV